MCAMSAEPRHSPSGPPPRTGSSRAPRSHARPDAAAAGARDGAPATRRLAGLRRASAGAARGAGRAGRATGRGGRGMWRGLRRLTHSRGAGESGLARVIELHLVATLADTLIVTALATTIFFA